MIKITAADKYFSLCVRERARWTCERCGKQYEARTQGLHCSHYFGRRHKSTRYHPDNAFSHCMYCHFYLGSNPHYFAGWVKEMLGEGRLEILLEKHREIIKKQDLKAIAKHYLDQLREMKDKRANGEMGRLEFVDYE